MGGRAKSGRITGHGFEVNRDDVRHKNGINAGEKPFAYEPRSYLEREFRGEAFRPAQHSRRNRVFGPHRRHERVKFEEVADARDDAVRPVEEQIPDRSRKASNREKRNNHGALGLITRPDNAASRALAATTRK